MDLRRPEPIGERTPTLPAIWRSLRSRPAVLWPCFFGMVDKFTFGLITVLTALALKDEFGLSAVVWGGSALGMLWIGFLLASAMAGALVRRVGPWVTVAIGSAGYGIALSLLLYWDSPRAFVALLTAAGAFVAIQTLPTYTLIGQLAGAESRATATAGFNVLGSYGLMAGIIFAGIASTRIGYPATFMVGGVVELLSAAIALFLGWRFVPLKAPVLANAQTATPPPRT
jgi:MFS family permease